MYKNKKSTPKRLPENREIKDDELDLVRGGIGQAMGPDGVTK